MKKQINPNIQAYLLRAAFYALMLVAMCAIPFALAQRTVTKPEAPAKFSQRTLSFEERVAYQRAIEEVYWRHRIWPKQRPDPKPSLDAVMSQTQIEKKVEDYLRDSEMLEDYWQRPIRPEQLQAEMDRMAEHTKQPEVLRELFEALGNDPFVIAECLVRPALTERLTADLSARGKARGLVSQRSKALHTIAAATMVGNVTYAFPKISQGDPPWTGDSSMTDAADAREVHTAVWTGSEMIIWGGGHNDSYLNTGGRYNPSTDSWAATSISNAPPARAGHEAVWTGSEMIIWGGYNPSYLNTGERYDPSTNSWAAISTSNAPSLRAGHEAVWTGSEMIIWGGYNPSYLNTGGRYDPSTDSWAATSTPITPPIAHPATYIASNSFTANWSSVSGATGYWLDVSTNSSFSTYVPGYQNLNVGNATNRSVTGLNPSTTYHYRVRAYNDHGSSGNSNTVNVTTLSPTGPPVAVTNPSSYVASFSARLNGSVDPHGLTTTVYFQYGTTTSYGLTTAIQTKTGNTYQNVVATIGGLTASTTYHFRIVATNGAGTRYGSDRTFTTLSADRAACGYHEARDKRDKFFRHA